MSGLINLGKAIGFFGNLLVPSVNVPVGEDNLCFGVCVNQFLCKARCRDIGHSLCDDQYAVSSFGAL